MQVPTLFDGGRYEFEIPDESAQMPFLDMIGTPTKKKRVIFDGGHVPTEFNDVIRENPSPGPTEWMGPMRRTTTL
jgi:hypothetical protein